MNRFNLRNRSALQKNQKGMTLIETIVVLALVGLALAGLAWGINKAFGGSDIKDEQTAVTTLIGSLPDIRTSAGYGAANTNLMPQLIAQNAIPTNWPVSGGVPSNAWGGTISVASTGTAVAITSTQVPQEACNKLVVKLSKGANFQTTKIGANTAVTGEVTAATAQAQCAAGANTIVWTTRN